MYYLLDDDDESTYSHMVSTILQLFLALLQLPSFYFISPCWESKNREKESTQNEYFELIEIKV